MVSTYTNKGFGVLTAIRNSIILTAFTIGSFWFAGALAGKAQPAQAATTSGSASGAEVSGLEGFVDSETINTLYTPGECYTVQRGDTMWQVAREFGYTPNFDIVGWIADTNLIEDPSNIKVGQVICDPGPRPPIPVPAEPEQSPEVCYVVQPGNTLFGIVVRKLGLPKSMIDVIAEWSGIEDITQIKPGQEIYCQTSDESTSVMIQQNNIQVWFTYYNPIRGGINCNSNCRHTASGARVLEDDFQTPYGPGWFNPETNYGWTAAPQEFPFGTIFTVNLPNGEVVTLEKQDNGGAIIITNEGYIRLDILYDDGLGPGDQGWSLPRTRQGFVLNRGPFDASYTSP